MNLLAIIALTSLVGNNIALASNESPKITSKKKKPNVVILFADNLAYNDVGTFQTESGGTRSRTPRTDEFATEGLKLLNWNSGAVLCSASRAALLTGKYPVKTGVYPRVFEPDAVQGLLANETTLADYLKASKGTLHYILCSL